MEGVAEMRSVTALLIVMSPFLGACAQKCEPTIITHDVKVEVAKPCMKREEWPTPPSLPTLGETQGDAKEAYRLDVNHFRDQKAGYIAQMEAVKMRCTQ